MHARPPSPSEDIIVENLQPVSPPGPERIVAMSDAEYVDLLNETARIPADSAAEYMKRFSTIYESTSRVRVSFDSPEAFVADLKAAGRLLQQGTTYTLLPGILAS